MGALGYNLKKMDERFAKRAELLASSFASADASVIKKEVELIRSLRPNLGRYVYHTSLNFLNEEADMLTNDKLLLIALDYLKGMGFINNQYLIFRHYDADHPHIHILANRITFDGDVVSDSNNFQRSEQLLRRLEYLYNLKPVEQSNFRSAEPYKQRNIERYNRQAMYSGNKVAAHQNNQIATEPQQYRTQQPGNTNTIEHHNYAASYPYNKVTRRAPKKNEIEMALRTGKPSGKLLLQELLSQILQQQFLNMQDFIQQCEANGIYLLFNRASTGRISGITYFHENFKSKGQALGEKFKWMEIVKQLDYEQDRDGSAVSQENRRTKERYGEYSLPGEQQQSPRQGSNGLHRGDQDHTSKQYRQQGADGQAGSAAYSDSERTIQHENNDTMYRDNPVTVYRDTADLSIQIADDIDDEAIYGKDRHRQKKARTNTR